MNCRHCSTPLEHSFVDLGHAPPSNSYLTLEGLSRPEKTYPLKVMVCTECWLVQTLDYTDAGELFDADYAYFSSTSTGWLAHARRYCDEIRSRLALDERSLVIEVASNDGYLLKNFVEWGIPCLGVEPTASTAAAAEALGVPVTREFFGEVLARRLRAEGKQADLIVGNNVYAHVPDINDFTRGLKTALKASGTITLEFPHLLRLIQEVQFDTIYHEHFSYLSLTSVSRIFKAAGLKVWDVQELPTHGGSLRVFGCHAEDSRPIAQAVSDLLENEEKAGLLSLKVYEDFQGRAEQVKLGFLDFLIEQKKAGKRVGAYGAAAKGNTLMNFAGVKPDLLPFVADAAPSKQGKFMPGSHLPIVTPDILRKNRPDFVIIFPWNIANEVRAQNADLVNLGTQMVTLVPRLEVI
ncbi:class I SAM-dependent methyltransferase [Agrobacterium tumefaciens]|uniref:class I SAM-dependent methyltransferase n=1 Tax=Agrobacterium tumefaciens TaxID=358 RepID=UPI00287DE4E5|nr:class I SAM-dependent methyltransferase [Agrobacterium tumefaciens]MDS7594762.1 class I SAM-dependent methyltransferase [Agrobacterium tumefaciens]